jgi:hypothetical protein
MQHYLRDKEQVNVIIEHSEEIKGHEVTLTDLIVYENGYQGTGMPGFNWEVQK